jgi:alpha-1,3/alpha-1,6-mannosyltransferase
MKPEMVGAFLLKIQSGRRSRQQRLSITQGTLDVRVRGDKLFPQSVGGRLMILCAILRQIALVVSTSLLSNELKTLAPDVIFVDQLSICVPLFRIIYPRAKILFYGHYPDRLLVKQDQGWIKHIKNIYRVPFDTIEEWSTGCADSIVVNSKYTRSVYRSTFPWFRIRSLRVIYPCVDTKVIEQASSPSSLWPDKKLLLSINRFEGKKDLSLAVEAYAGLSKQERSKARLVLAGGYDSAIHENVRTHKALQELADSLQLTHATFKSQDTALTDMSTDDVDVLFLLSVPQELKARLLQSASILVYTPTNEHFGIVPLEAMLAGVPVLATNTGGPLETIYDGRTGWLRSPSRVDQWTDVMRKPLIPSSAGSLAKMGQSGKERVLAEFSQTKMTELFNHEIQRVIGSTEKRPKIMPEWLYALVWMVAIAIPAIAFTMKVMWWALDADQTSEAQRIVKNAEKSAASLTSSASA